MTNYIQSFLLLLLLFILLTGHNCDEDRENGPDIYSVTYNNETSFSVILRSAGTGNNSEIKVRKGGITGTVLSSSISGGTSISHP